MAVRSRAVAAALVLWGASGIRDSFSDGLMGLIGQDESRGWRLALVSSGIELRAQGSSTTTPPTAVREFQDSEEQQRDSSAEGSSRAHKRSRHTPTPEKEKTASFAHLHPRKMYKLDRSGGTPEEGPHQRSGSHERFEAPGETLNVHAVTFNAGNQKFKEDAGWTDMFDRAKEGVDDADIVVFGFQEIYDPQFHFVEMAKRELWKESSTAKLSGLIEDVSTLPADVKQAKDNAMERLTSDNREQFDVDAFIGLMAPIRAGAEKVLQEAADKITDAYPNLQVAGDMIAGLRIRLENLHQMFARMRLVQHDINHMTDTEDNKKLCEFFLRMLSEADFLHGTQSQRSAKSLDQIVDDIDAYLDDCLSGPKTSHGASSLASEQADATTEESAVRSLRVDVPTARQTWHSGSACHLGKHYDTHLHVFVNPWSRWRVEPDPWFSDACVANDGSHQKDSESKGCSIDNNRHWSRKHPTKKPECGKVVQVLRFRATRVVAQSASVIRICVMNTHMSRKGGTTKRLEYLKEAATEAELAGCDSFVFVGDFNSRLDCERPLVVHQGDCPVSEHRDSNKLNSLDTVLSLFKSTGADGEAYLLTGNNKLADELTQYLHQQIVICWEGSTKIELDNPIQKLNIVEGELKFNPTYKLKYLEDRQESFKELVTPFVRCVPGMNKCYYNKPGEGKNNPAWPDRVLARSTSGAQVFSYQSLDISSDHGSDHNPVVCAVAFLAPPQQAQTVQ